MKTIYFKCKLLSDVVLNSSLATEGNLQSLDYISGSNFLGIVAKKYEDFGEKAFDIFHSGKVSFGDALISKNNAVSYKMPFSLFQDKLENEITKNTVWVHHGIKDFEEIKDKENNKRQLKQHRSGYLNADKKYIKKVEKEFALKSAYNADERRSDDGKMFGFEALKKGQEFIFSVIFEDENLSKELKDALIGQKHIGKSKTAQYGLVDISEIKEKPQTFESKETKNYQLVIYAESNLCFLNEYGQASFQPEASDFGLEKGEIIWDKSQIRTYTYSPWNTKRNTSDTQRDVILKGSVIVIDLAENENINVDSLPKQVGEYNAEGLGRVIYNPEFLEFDENNNGIWNYSVSEYPKDKKPEKISREKHDENLNKFNPKTNLAGLLKSKALKENKDLEIGEKIIELFNSDKGKILLDKKITKSQWGAIRTKATIAQSVEALITELQDYLSHGVAAKRIWDKQNGKRREALLNIIEENKDLGLVFIVKFASEIRHKV